MIKGVRLQRILRGLSYHGLPRARPSITQVRSPYCAMVEVTPLLNQIAAIIQSRGILRLTAIAAHDSTSISQPET